MLLSFVFSVYFLNFAFAQWETIGLESTTSSYITNVVGLDGKPDFSVPNIPLESVQQIPIFEITNQNAKCYTISTVMNMVHGILAYITENPSKTEHLHHLFNFITDNSGSTDKLTNRVTEAMKLIERDRDLSRQEKITLRGLLDLVPPVSDMKTTIVFKYELPSINQPHCKNTFMQLLEVAYNAYMKFAQNPRCEPMPLPMNEKYDQLNQHQPNIPIGEINWDGIKHNNWPNFDGGKWNGNNEDNIKEILDNILSGVTKPPIEDISTENWINIFPQNNPSGYDYNPQNTNPYSPEPITPIYPSPDNLNDGFIDNIIKLLTQYQSNNNNPNPKLYEYILSISKSLQNGSNNPKMYSLLVELLNNKNYIGLQNPKLVELILLHLSENKKYVPGPQVIQILTPLLKPNENGEVHPRIIELIIRLLKLNKNEPSKQRYQVLISLLNPTVNGEVNPKIIEIITSLHKVNENSMPNHKLIQIIMAFLKLNLYSIHSKHIDQLLYLLKLNDNHYLPDQLYYQIIQFLLKFNASKKDSTNNHFYYPNPDSNKQTSDNSLLALLLLKSPYLYNKLAPNQHISLTNQFNSNNAGIVELTYLLKRPTPFVYQPFFHYIKYRLPLQNVLLNLRNILSKNPQWAANPKRIYQELITISNVSAVSPNLKGYSKEDMQNLTFNNGALVTAKILDDSQIRLDEQINLAQNMNVEMQPDAILNLKQQMPGDFADEKQTMNEYYTILKSGKTLKQNGQGGKITVIARSPYHVSHVPSESKIVTTTPKNLP